MLSRFNCWNTRPVGIYFRFKQFLSITAFLGNALIITALRKESSLHPPSKLLLRSLATVTDLCVGLISQHVFVTYLMSAVKEHWNICRYVITARLIDYTLCGANEHWKVRQFVTVTGFITDSTLC